MKSVFKFSVVIALMPCISAAYAGGNDDQGNKAFAKHFPEPWSYRDKDNVPLGMGEFIVGGVGFVALGVSAASVHDVKQELKIAQEKVFELTLIPTSETHKKGMVQRSELEVKEAVAELESRKRLGVDRRALRLRAEATEKLNRAQDILQSIKNAAILAEDDIKSQRLVKQARVVEAQEKMDQYLARRALPGSRIRRGLLGAGASYLMLDMVARIYVTESLNAKAGLSPLVTIALGETTDVVKSMVSDRPAGVSKEFEEGYQRGVMGHGFSSLNEDDSEFRRGQRAGLQKYMSGGGR